VDIWTSFTRQQVEETGKDYIFTVFMVCNTWLSTLQ
jgi:hypothetical protein